MRAYQSPMYSMGCPGMRQAHASSALQHIDFIAQQPKLLCIRGDNTEAEEQAAYEPGGRLCSKEVFEMLNVSSDLNRQAGVQPRIFNGITRKLTVRDQRAVLEHLLRLGADDRYMRFFSPSSDASISTYVERIDWSKAHMIGHFSGARLVALAELIPVGLPWQRMAELAVSVEQEWRGQGLGRKLCDLAVDAAYDQHMHSVRLLVLAENHGMLHLLQSMGAQTSFDAGMVTADIRLRPAVQAWLLAAMARVGAVVAHVLHLPARAT